MKDPQRRKRVMQRSIRLGHCICDPRRNCPCDVFTDHGICPCAGERPDPTPAESVRLTEMVHNAGCASKIAPGDLQRVLSRLPAVDDPAVVSGIPAGDDAKTRRTILWLLKRAWRNFGWKCVEYSVERESEET